MADDRGEIKNLLARYCELYDSGDFETYCQLFAHARLGSQIAKMSGSDAVRAFQEENTILYDGLPQTRHLTTNVHIEIAQNGLSASARSYVVVVQALSDFPLQPVFIGQYQDELEKIDGCWCFTQRYCEPFLAGDLSRHGREYAPPGPLEGRYRQPS